jgi:hypothetical protein
VTLEDKIYILMQIILKKAIIQRKNNKNRWIMKLCLFVVAEKQISVD